MRPLRAIGKTVGRVVAIAGVLVMLLAGGAAGWVRTSRGGEHIRRVIESQVNHRINGTLRVRRLLIGRSDITLEGIELRDAQGAAVATVERLYLRLSLLGLLRHQLLVSTVDIRGPQLFLSSNANGESNLSRALALRQPPSSSVRATKPQKASGWKVWLGTFQLTNGSIEIIRSDASTIAASRIHLACDGSYADEAEKSFRIHLRMAGDAQQPVRKPVTLVLDAGGALTILGLNSQAALTLGVGRSLVRLSLATDALARSKTLSDTRGRAAVVIEDGAIAPSELAELYPALQPSAELHVTGRAGWDGRLHLVSAQLHAKARAMQATITLSAGTWPPVAASLVADVEHIDLSDWLADGPRSDFGIDVRGQGKGPSTEALVGSLDVRVPTGRMGGYPFGPMRLSIAAKPDHFTLAEMVARFPGGRLNGHGEISSGQVALRLRVEAENLSRTARVLVPARSAALRSLAGRGSLQIDARGRLRTPSLRLSADFKELQLQESTMAALQLRAFVPNIRQPLAANVAVTIPQTRVGGRSLHGLSLQLRALDSRLRATFAMAAPERVRVLAEGHWRRRHESLVLDRLDVGLQRKAWSIARPAQVAWNGPDIRLTGLDLRATQGDEWLQLDTEFNRRRVFADLRLHGFQLEELPPGLLPARLGLVGQLDAEVHARGAWSAPELRGMLAVRHGEVSGCAVGDVTLSAESRPGRPSSVTAKIRPPPGTTDKNCVQAVDVLVRMQAPSGGSWSRQAMTTQSHLEMRLRGIDIGFLARMGAKPGAYGGRVDVDATMDGPLETSVVKAELRATGVHADGVPPTDGAVTLTLSNHDLSGHLRIDRRGAPLLVADFQTKQPAALLRARTTAGIAGISLRLHAEAGPLSFQHTSLSLVAPSNDGDTLRGTASAVIDVGGTLGEPHATVRADVKDLRLGNTSWGDAQADVSYASGTLDASLSTRDRRGGDLSLRFGMKAPLGYPHFMRPIAWERQSIAGQLDAHSADLSLLSTLSSRWHDVSGRLQCHLTWSGTVADPMPVGSVEILDGAMTVTDVGRYKNIHLSLRGDREYLTLDELKLTSGDGSVTLAASASHRSGGAYDVNGTVSVDKFPVYSDGQAVASVSSKATAKAEISSSKLSASAMIRSARIAMNDAKRKKLSEVSRPKDVVVLRDAQPLRAVARQEVGATGAAMSPPSPSVIVVNAPRNLWVNGKDASVEIGLEPDFRVELSTPARIYGEVVVKRGRIDILGKRFHLKADSSLRFQGPADDPQLDITAQYVNEQERVTVVATVKGVPKHLTTTLTAPDRPDLTESQLYTLVLTGRLSFAQGPASSASPAGQAGSFLGGLMAAELQKVVAKKLPFDVLTIEGGDTMGAAKVEAGKYIASDVYVGYVGRLGADPTLLQNRNAVHLEYMMGTDWSFEGEYGDAKSGSGDVVWTKHY